MLVNRLDRLELDPIVGVLNSERVVVLNQPVGLPDEVHGPRAQQRHHRVNVVFVGVVTEDFNLALDVTLLVGLQLRCRLSGKTGETDLLELIKSHVSADLLALRCDRRVGARVVGVLVLLVKDEGIGRELR